MSLIAAEGWQRRPSSRCLRPARKSPIAVAAREASRRTQGLPARVVSVPCFELLLAAPDAERAAIIGEAPVNVAVEAGIRQGWDAIIGSDGAFVGMSGFGASAPYKELYQHFGITPEKVAETARLAWRVCKKS